MFRSATRHFFPALLLLIVTIGCIPFTEADDADEREAAALEARVFDLINVYRDAQGLPPLIANAEVAEIARAHSEAMGAGRVPFGHDGFADRAGQIIRDGLGTSVGENVAWNAGYRDVAGQAFDAWIASQGHHENIVGDYTETGIGVVRTHDGRYFLTQLFVR